MSDPLLQSFQLKHLHLKNRIITTSSAAGITMLADAESTFTTAIGMDFSAPPAGLMARSKRYAMLVEDGTVSLFQAEESPGMCDVSGGEALLASM